MAVRLRDIAEQIGVSVNTVSRALTGKPDVNPETRARIAALAAQLGYTPNFLARSLLRGRSHTIGLVVTDCTDPFYATLIRAAEHALSQGGFGLLLATSNESSGKEKQALDMLRERRVDGLLFTPVDVGAPHVREALASDLPIVLLSRRPAGHPGPFIGIDNQAGAVLLIRHLLDLGHRRIAHVTRSDRASSAGERLAGYRAALEAAGIAPSDALVHQAEPNVAGGRGAAEWLMALDPRPTAVFTYNDAQAVGLILAAQAAGLRVPQDLSVAGFDDIELSSLIQPRLTTVAQPIEEIGSRGARMVIGMIQGKPSTRPVVLTPVLVARESTAALSASAAPAGTASAPARRSRRAEAG